MNQNLTHYRHLVHYYETDQMGIVHHSNYIRWMEEARSDYLEKVGYSYVRLEAAGIVSPVVSVSCDYKVSCRFGDTVEVRLKLTGYTGVRCDVEYEMYRLGDGTLCAVGRSQHCFIDKAGRPLSLKKHMPEMHEKLKSLVGIENVVCTEELIEDKDGQY